MNNEIPEAIRPLIMQLVGICQMADQQVKRLEEARAEHANHVLKRNSTLITLTPNENEAKDALFKWTLADDNQVTATDIVTMALERMSADLEKIGGNFIAKFVVMEREMGLAQAAAARMREHPTHSEDVRRQVWEWSGGKCHYCGTEIGLQLEFGKATFHIDHIVARANGGPDHVSNYVPACSKCNGAKSDKPYLEFIRQRGEMPVVLRVINGGQE